MFPLDVGGCRRIILNHCGSITRNRSPAAAGGGPGPDRAGSWRQRLDAARPWTEAHTASPTSARTA